jgi:hypothetical protein
VSVLDVGDCILRAEHGGWDGGGRLKSEARHFDLMAGNVGGYGLLRMYGEADKDNIFSTLMCFLNFLDIQRTE